MYYKSPPKDVLSEMFESLGIMVIDCTPMVQAHNKKRKPKQHEDKKANSIQAPRKKD